MGKFCLTCLSIWTLKLLGFWFTLFMKLVLVFAPSFSLLPSLWLFVGPWLWWPTRELLAPEFDAPTPATDSALFVFWE